MESRNKLHNAKIKMNLHLLNIKMFMLCSASQYFLVLYMKVICTLSAFYRKLNFSLTFEVPGFNSA